MNILNIAILPLISTIFIVFIGVFVFFKNKNSKINQVFVLFILVMSIWLFASYMMLISTSDQKIIFWDRIVYIGVVFVPFVAHLFSVVFTKIKNQKKIVYFGLLLSFLFLIISRTDYFVSDLFKYQWGAHTKAQFFHHIFLVYFIFYIFLTYSNFYKYYKTVSSVLIKQQTKYILLAFLIFIGVGSTEFLPAYSISVFPFGYTTGVLFVIIIAYAITRYRFMDIKVVLKKSFIYGLSMFVLFILVVGGGVAVERFLEFYLGVNSTVVLVLIMAAMIWFFPYLKSYVRNKLDNIFRKEYIDLSKKFDEIKEYSFLLDFKIEGFCKELSMELEKISKLTKINFFVLDDKNELFNRYYPENNEVMEVRSDSLLILNKIEGIIIKDELSYFKGGEIRQFKEDFNLKNKEIEFLIKRMTKDKIDIIIPFKFNDELVGFLSGGVKDDVESFSSKDIEFFEYVQERTRVVLGQLRQRNNFLK